ncbi:MAG: ABC transporter permease subunit [Tissierellia bacterium]|nr:ABC transporter permease subunit [Tissierellia bacterium]
MTSEYLYDHLDRAYPRKNLYLKDLAQLQAKDADQSQIKDFISSKAEHPYTSKLNDYKKNEKIFIQEKKKASQEKISQLKVSNDLSYFLIEKFEAEEDLKFYQKYLDLTYDAELGYESALILSTRLDGIISNLEKMEREITELEACTAILDGTDKFNHTFISREDYKASIKELKSKRKEGLISAKALETGRRELKEAYKYSKELRKLEDPEYRLKKEIQSKKHAKSNYVKTSKRLLKDDLAQIRRRVPIEIERKRAYLPWISLPFPGLGQLLNNQKAKALLFFLAGLFIYLVAIPYSLGFANYQGKGLAGLISLAAGGKRTDRSIIFMIEGIIALTLLTLSALIIIFSFLDVKKVNQDRYKGIRTRNWFETRSSILEDGFPYLVSLPAFFVIVFIVIVPIMTTLLLSFANMGPKTQSKFPWIGLANYKLLITGQGLVGSVFWKIFLWTIIWTIGATSLAIFIGFALALLAHNPRIKGKGILRTIYLLPWAVPAFITIMFFSIMFSPGGELSLLLSKLMGRTIDVKNSMIWTRAVLILLQGWLGSSYIFLLSTGVLQAIPDDLYEAAEIDGANSWQRVLKITLPIVLFQTAPLLVNQYTFNFNNFSIIYLFNGGGPFSPLEYGNLAGSSDILISYIYKLTINNQYQSVGAAVSIFISMGLMLIAYLGFRNTKAFKEERL